MTGKKGLLSLLLIVAILISAILVYITFFSGPTIVSVDPEKDKTNVLTNRTIKVNFSEPIKIGNNFIELKNSAGTIVPIKKSIKNNLLFIDPETELSKGTKYTLIIHTGSVTDASGNKVAAYTTYFTTKP